MSLTPLRAKERRTAIVKNVGVCLIGIFMSLLLGSYAVADQEFGYVKQAIAAKGAKWHAGETSVSKLSHEERKMRLGLVTGYMPDAPQLAAPAPSDVTALSPTLDWRNYNGGNFVTPVRDQGGCGSCWAFATAANLESSTLIKNNTPGIDLDLSEQVLVSCGGAGSCSGGYTGSASEYIKNTGLPEESCYPYTGSNGTCSIACSGWQASAYKISGWSYVTTSAPTVTAIKNALNTYGPVNTQMQVYADFFYYAGGIYHYTTGTYQGGHAILIVGYDDVNQCFICKNSWGTGWGEAGFFRILYSELNSVTYFGDFTIAYQNGAPPPPSPVNGQCGSANNGTFTAAPTTNLCSAGTASAVSGAGPWTWTCAGSNGGTTASCSANIQTWTVTPSAGSNGTISPNTPQTVNNAATTSFTVTPAAGYSASVGGTCTGTLSGTTYTTNPVTASCTVTATFTASAVNGQCGSANNGTFTAAPTTNLCSAGTASAVSGAGPWTWTCAGSNGGTTASCSANIQTWTVTPSAGSNGTISPNTPQTVNNAATTSFTVTPAAGYSASVGGTCGGSPASGTAAFTYTTNPVTASCTVTATFTVRTWTVTPSAGSNGTISPNTTQTVNNAATTSFTVTPAAGYSASVGGTCGGSPASGTAAFTYTTNPVTASCTVTATFTASAVNGQCDSANNGTFSAAPTTNLCSAGTASAVSGAGPWTWTCAGSNGGTTASCSANIQTWTVTSSVTGGNGTISCASPVNDGLSSPCTINPNKGYRLAALTDNGSDVAGQVVGNMYTISSVTTNHVVIASFVSPAIILWRNVSTGENSVWYMDGSTHTATATLESLTGAWRMVATADFDSDGEPDILWRNMSTGANMVWYMNGALHTGSADLTPMTDQDWKIVGVADFNNDARPDILWRNVSTGANMVWHMNGVTQTDSADLTPVVDQNWKIAGVADFNQDGNPDIAWRNSATGQDVVWYMEGITRTGTGFLDTVTDQNWKMIVGTDLDNDGKPNILWRNTATGANMAWYMNGIADTAAMLDTVTDENMEIAGQGNYSAPAPPPPPIAGQCGSSNGGTFATAPTTDLCSAGTASAVTGTGPWTWTCVGLSGGTDASCQANQTIIQTWTVTPSAGSNGTISPNTPQTVNNAATTSFTVTPAAGYSASVGGTCTGTLSGTTYTTNPITTDCTVVAMFTSLPPSGVCGSANGGIFTSAPTTNLCDVGTASAVTGRGPWIWTCQAANGTVQCQANSQALTVTSSVTGGNGTISCASPVNYGLSSPCTITPNKGYRLATLTDNGSDVTGQAIGNVYTIPGVTTNHAVIVSFVTRGAMILWRNISTGENTVWYMNGSTHTATATLDPLPGAWRMAATADFNNDGEPDILWRNMSTGANMVWYMNGATQTGSVDLAPLTDQNWKIVGVGDFNNDEEPDILWRNMSTGANMVWYMNGALHAGSADLTPMTDQDWKIVGVADFNNDARPDILWRNVSTGANMVWHMNGVTQTDSADLTPVVDQNWKIAGVADFNQDGNPDIAWRNSATGQDVVWYMEDATHTGTAFLDTVTDQNMEIAGQGNN